MSNAQEALNALAYPFDANYILSKKKRLRRQLLELDRDYITKKIAILGGYTTHDIKLVLELFLLRHGIRAEFYESEYNRYYQDAMFPNAELEAFSPDLIYICTGFRNLSVLPRLSDSEEMIDALLRSESDKYRKIWDRLLEVYHCPVIQNNFELPMYRLLGNKDATDPHGVVHFVTHLNMEFNKYAGCHDNFYICDVNYISADYGLKEWSEPFYWYMYKYGLNISAIPLLSHNVANIIKSIFGKNKKGFVLDLDNTLWGGVIGDDGVDNIKLGPEEAEGQAYMEFQQYIKAHKQLGVVLNIASKNDEENALSGLQHPDSVLHPDDFVVMRANWNPKDRNFAEIAEQMNVLPESLVFVDDNPAEREIVAARFWEVSVPDINEIHDYIHTIDRSGFFEVTNLSKDDVHRTEMYQENLQRVQSMADFQNYRDYLLSLDMRAAIRPFESVYMARIAQLTNKSNQFNLTTKRYTQAELETLSETLYVTLYGKLEDRFGDNGVVSVVIGRINSGICHIDLWLMSCRVLKRDVEYAMMDALVKKCIGQGIAKIRGYYIPTMKNKMVKDFFATMGFEKISEDEQGNTVWEYDISTPYINKNKVIRVEE